MDKQEELKMIEDFYNLFLERGRKKRARIEIQKNLEAKQAEQPTDSVEIERLTVELELADKEVSEVISAMEEASKALTFVPEKFHQQHHLKAIAKIMRERNSGAELALYIYENDPYSQANIALTTLRESEERARREAEARRLEYYSEPEETYYSEPSSGRNHGFLRDVAAVAAGTFIGNKAASKGKKDLYGTSVCQRTKHYANPTMKQFSCMTCPAKDRCTQNYR